MFLHFIGLEVGILLCFYEYIFVNLHLHSQHIDIPLYTYFMQLFFCHASYGFDRIQDVKSNESNNKELIEYINNNELYVNSTITGSIIISILYLINNEYTRFLLLPFILSVLFYRDFKKALPLLKPFFISSLLITSAVIVPSIMTESNLNILQDFNALIPPFANLYSSSNYLDIIDYNIDKINNIKTLPVLLGNNTALITSIAANTIASLSHINHPNFGNNPIEYIFEVQNILTGVSLFKKNPVDFRKIKNKDDNIPKMSINYYKARFTTFRMTSRLLL